MSKSVRLKDYLVVEVERRAGDENRSFANMVERLLEQALRLRPQVTTDVPEVLVGVMAPPEMDKTRREPPPAAPDSGAVSSPQPPPSYFPELPEREVKPDPKPARK